MGGCCGKQNQLDHGQESKRYTEQRFSTVNDERDQENMPYIDDSAKFLNTTHTSRNIANVDKTSFNSTDPISKTLWLDSYTPIIGAQQHTSAGKMQPDIVVNKHDIKVNRIPLKEIWEEDERENKVTSCMLMRIKPNKKIVQDILAALSNIPPTTFHANKVYSLETLDLYSKKGNSVMSKFTNRKFRELYKINKIEQVNNPYLLAQYEIRKAKTQIVEQILYHGTRAEHLDSICTYNFDWRVVRNCKFGFGVSFANNPYYASHYSTKGYSTDGYVMILAKVLIGRTCLGKKDLIYPQESFDTTTNSDGQVLVKYDDCTFYPEFLVYFEENELSMFI